APLLCHRPRRAGKVRQSGISGQGEGPRLRHRWHSLPWGGRSATRGEGKGDGNRLPGAAADGSVTARTGLVRQPADGAATGAVLGGGGVAGVAGRGVQPSGRRAWSVGQLPGPVPDRVRGGGGVGGATTGRGGMAVRGAGAPGRSAPARAAGGAEAERVPPGV